MVGHKLAKARFHPPYEVTKNSYAVVDSLKLLQALSKKAA